ncbi:hypothetical protein FJTKL_00043 [Diaporthe vaccinii]|uniref:Uncharacterized protein n=1 Tax=Diaporthe vaccinii TaxID=105482 RepID=A0ABR4E4H6_9PEZI
MSNSPQNPEIPTESPSEAENNATATAPTKASPGHELIETTQTALAKNGCNEECLAPAFGLVIPRPTKTVECNMMSYTDGEGVARKIYMPKGTARLAGTLYTAKRFDDLARFPVWGECQLVTGSSCPSPCLLVCVGVFLYSASMTCYTAIYHPGGQSDVRKLGGRRGEI